MDKEDVEDISNGILHSHKKNEIIPCAATWTDLGIITLSEVSQTPSDITYMWTLKYDTNELTFETDSQILRTNLLLPRVGWESDGGGVCG